MKIRFNTVDNIPISKIIDFRTITTIVRSITKKIKNIILNFS